MRRALQPHTWEDVKKLIEREGLDQEEYFTVEEEVLNDEVWQRDTWRILVWLCEGSNEGFYLHIDEVKIVTELGQRKEDKRQPRALGKFYDLEEALRAQTLLWHYLYGFAVEVQEEPAPSWSPVWVGG